MTDAAYVYIENDTQGPWVLLCRACIEADRHEVTEWEAPDGWRCACCGAASEYDEDGIDGPWEAAMDEAMDSDVIDGRRMRCTTCRREGVRVDTTAGEIIGDRTVCVPDSELWLMADGMDTTCDDCDAQNDS